MTTLRLPPKTVGGNNVEWPDVRCVVILGANGSGKSRLGLWIERNTDHDVNPVHRISAQRALSVPELVTPRPYEQAMSQLHYGYYQPGRQLNRRELANHKWGHRWGNDGVVGMLNDFEHLLTTLFAEEAKRNRDYTRTARDLPPSGPAPECKLDRVVRIWAAALPQRELLVGDDKIDAQVKDGKPYAAKGMSDGERVALYLIGQAECAPDGAILVIDEPEVHLHRAIQASLWDEIEKARPDCVFVYITHDLEFAATRTAARKVWLREYDGTHWTWEELAPTPGLPEPLVYQVVGSRRPVLFSEGEETSYDVALYRALYPARLVIPRSGCDKVIEATRAMGDLAHMHRLDVRGLVDRDRRSDEEIDFLRDAGIVVADVAEVENLFCLREALECAAEQLRRPDVAGAVATAETRVLDELRKGLDAQITSRALSEIQFRLNGFGPRARTADARTIEQALSDHVKGIDVHAAFGRARAVFEDTLARQDYRSALRYYNCKGIPSFVASALGLKPEVYNELIMGILRAEPWGRMAEAMRKAISDTLR